MLIVGIRFASATYFRRTLKLGSIRSGSKSIWCVAENRLKREALISPLRLNLGSVSYLSRWRPPNTSNRNQGLLGLLGTSAIVLAGKGKYVLGALKLTKFASLGSMIVSIGAYSMIFGLPYAVGLVGQLVLHESGHALVLLRMGIPFSPMVFVPFMGAFVNMESSARSAYDMALIAFGGPVLGAIGAGGIALSAHIFNSQLLFALADFGFAINLFNLLPIGMLDGGKICDAISPYVGVAGLGLGGSLIYSGIIANPIFYLVMISGCYNTFMRFYKPQDYPYYYSNTSQFQKGTLTAGYFGLIGSLVAAMAINEKYKRSPEQLRYYY